MYLQPMTITREELELAALVRHIIEGRRDDGRRKTGKPTPFRSIGTEWGISHAHIKNVHAGNNVGGRVAKKIASKMYNGSMDAMAAAARRFAEEHPDEVTQLRATLVDSEPVNPKEAVKRLESYKRAPKAAREAFDRDPYVQGDVHRNEEWYIRRLLRAIDDARMGVIDGAIIDGAKELPPVPDPDVRGLLTAGSKTAGKRPTRRGR